MATKKPSFELFLYHASNLLSSGGEPKEVLAKIITLLHEHTGEAGVVIRLRISSKCTSGPLLIESPLQQKASFVFSRPIAVRGRQYGQLTVETRTPAGSPKDWMMTLEVLGQQLALFAERLELADDNECVQSEVDELQERLRIRKALARAGGIVARIQGTTAELAEEWLEAEAARRGRTAYVLAEQLILQDQISRQIVSKARQGAVAA